MPAAFIANALGGTTTTTSFSITLPATVAGDLIILEFTHRGTGDGTIGGTYSGGAFALKHSQLFATSTFSGKTYWSRATGNHSGETVTGSSLTNACAAIVTTYRGALASGDPLTDATIVGEQNASGNETQAEITTATDGAAVVLVVVNSPDLAVTAQACTSPGTLVARAERLSTGGTDASISHASQLKVIAGATGAFTWAQTNAASGSWAYAIQPEPTTINFLGAPATGTEQAVDSSITVAHTLLSGTDRVVEITVSAWRGAGGSTGPTVTYGGVTATEIVAARFVPTAPAEYFCGKYSVKEADLPADGANNAVVTFGETVDEKAVVVQAYSGVNQTTPWGDTDSVSATSAAATRTLTTAAGDWALGGLTSFSGFPTSGTGDFDIARAVGTGNAIDCSISGEVATGSSTTISFALSNEDHVFVGAVLQAAAGSVALTASTGAFTLTGNAATLRRGDDLAAATGAFTLTGNAADLRHGYPITADKGTFTLTGNDANLLYKRDLVAALRAFSLTGNDATLEHGYVLSAATGTVTLTGNDANLVYTPAGAYSLSADTGAFTESGIAADLLHGYVLVADTATFVLLGPDVVLSYGGSSVAPIVHGGRRQRRTIWAFRLGDQVYKFDSLGELLAFADDFSLEEPIEEKAEKDASRVLRIGKTKAKPKPPLVEIKTGANVAELRSVVDLVQRKIDDLYWSALATALARDAEEDDDIAYIASIL